MTLRTRTITLVCSTLALGLTLAASAGPALARWTFHDDRVGESITEPSGGTRAQACSTRLTAVTGWGHYIDVENGEDPAAYELPADARTALDYAVWKAPAGFSNFNAAVPIDGGVYFYDDDGVTRHQAKLVGRVKTRARAPLPTPTPASGKTQASGNFVFTTAPISIGLAGVKSGDALGLKPASATTFGFVNIKAIDCTLPVLHGKVDVIPGSRVNPVNPDNVNDLIPVRIYGSKALRVAKITEVHLGEADPSTVPAKLRASLKPKDVNRDGYPDRLYYFRQGDTDIMCIDTHVKVTGRTSDKKRFQDNELIAPADCSA